MNTRALLTVLRWAPVLVVASLLPVVPVQAQLAAFAVIALHAATAVRPTGRLLRLAALTGVLVPPLIAESLWPSALVALLALPGLPWLTSVLRSTSSAGSAEASALLRITPQQYVTSRAAALVASLLAAAAVGLLTEHPPLVGSSGLLLIFVGTLAAISLARIPTNCLTVHPPTTRVLAHDTLETGISLYPRARLPARLLVDLDEAWASISPDTFATERGPVIARLRVTPPLAGSKTVRARIRCLDPWGLLVTIQELDLAHVVVIPRATYAAHLARAYLEQTASGPFALAPLPQTQGAGSTRRGLDYYGARKYEPGDPLRDVFWKHTLKLRQLVMKERRSEHGDPVILAVNVWADDADALDQAAFSTLASALTLAREEVPVAFAAYTDEAIVSVTPLLAPRQAVLHALQLVGLMREVSRPARFLQPAHLARLHRRVDRLLASKTEAAARLARVLQFEYRARVSRAQHYPGYQAVLTAARRLGSPAALFVTSSGPDDQEAIELALQRLRPHGIFAMSTPQGAGARAMMPQRAQVSSPPS